MEPGDIILNENETVEIWQSTDRQISQEFKIAILELDGETTQTIEFW